MPPTTLQPRAKDRALRTAAALLAALSLVTCAEDPIGPATGRGHLLVIPVFGPYARVAPLTLDQVRIVVERQDARTETSDTLVDEVRAFDVNQNQLRIDDITIPMEVASEDLQVTLQLLSNTTLLWEGNQTVRVVRGQATAATSITVFYRGPGANVATLSLAPRDTVLSPGATLDYRLDAFDIQGAPVAQYYVSWSLTGGPATGARINAVGRLTAPSVPDTFYVKVVAPNGVADSTRAIVGTTTVPPASFAWTGAVSTDWSVAGNWNPTQVPGILDSVVIGAVPANRQPSLSTATVVGAVSIVAGGNLTINGQGLSIARGLTTGGTGVLTMTNEVDVVVVGGNAVFDGGSELNLLTAGGLSIVGNLTQAATNSGDSFHPTGTHITLLAGPSPTLSFATPATSQFQELAWVGTGTLTLATPVMTQGTFVVNAGTSSTVSSATGARLTVGDLVSVSAVVLNNVPLTLSQTTAGSLTLASVTFQNMPTTVSQLVVSHPGGTFDFTNLVFSTTPTAPNGFYIDVTDNTGPTDGALTINLANPTPASGGAFIKVAGGAIVNWPSSSTRTWTGAVSTDWSVAGNWSPAQIPSTAEDVVIPPTANSPTVTNSCSARTLTVNASAVLNLGAISCQVGGNVFADGSITGTGSVQIATTAQIRGQLPSLILSGPITLSGGVTVTGNVTVTGPLSDLNMSGHRATLSGGLVIQSGATITMVNPLDTLQVGGNAFFVGGSTTGRLTQGVLVIKGNFTQAASSSTTSFAPSGTHKTVLGDATARAIAMGSPGAGANGSHFQVLDVSNATGGLSLDVNMQADSLISTAAAATLTSAGVALTARRVDVSALTLNNTRFILDEQGTAMTENFSDVTFTGFPVPTTGTTMLTVMGPGSSLAARPVVQTDNVIFQSMAVGAGNFYVSLTSTNGATFSLTMNGSNQAPSVGGNGPTLTQTSPTGVATVSWP